MVFGLLHTHVSTAARCEMTDNDTLNKIYFDSISYKLYPSPGGGFASGNNAYLDKAKVQEFHAENLCNIYAVLLHFGYKNYQSLNDSSLVYINFYHLDNLGRNSLSSNVSCPGTIFYRDSLKVADIDTTNGNTLSFPNPLFTDSIFAIGISFEKMFSTDTVALYTNTDGNSGSREQSWEQDASGNWFTLKYNWPLSVDFAIFPVVNTAAGMEDIKVPPYELLIYPNPATEQTINFQIPNNIILDFKLYNSLLQHVEVPYTRVNSEWVRINKGQLATGIYYLSVHTKNGHQMGKIVIK